MDTNEAFTLVTFAKIDKDGRNSCSGFLGFIGSTPDVRDRQGTLLWIPSDPKEPMNNTIPDMREKPAAAIWFETTKKGQAKGKLHFEVLQDSVNGVYKKLEVVKDYTRTVPVWKLVSSGIFGLTKTYQIDTAHYNHPWNSYGLTYQIIGGKALLIAYVNGYEFGRAEGAPVRAYPSEYGMTMGARDIRNKNGTRVENKDESRKHLFGIMDQSGMNDGAWSPQDMLLWHNQVLKSTLVKYIKD